MANPLAVGVLALMATVMTFMWWIIAEPIIYNLANMAEGAVNEQAIPLIMTLRVQFYALPVGIAIFLWVWAFLAVTKRLVVTQPR